MANRWLPLLLLASPLGVGTLPAREPPALRNPGFEDGELGKAPPGWSFPAGCVKAGYSAKLSDRQPLAGARCATLERTAKDEPSGFGTLLQAINAKPLQGQRVRFRAAVRTQLADEAKAMLWMRVDRPKGEPGFFDNMADRPIVAPAWKTFEIVGDVAADATQVTVGLILVGNGTVSLDEAIFELAPDAQPTGGGQSLVVPGQKDASGIQEARMAREITVMPGLDATSLVFPLPLAYRDQTPISFHLQVNPPAIAKAVEIETGPGENRLMRVHLHQLAANQKGSIAFQSLILVRPSVFPKYPEKVPFPAEWPAEAKPWLSATWCVDSDHERIKKIASEIRGQSDDVLKIIDLATERSVACMRAAKGKVANLTAVEALDKQGSCTSNANLVAAVLRACGVPARVLSGYPIWSGPLQTHYIVEAYVPGFGWHPIESTVGKSPWPNHQQVNVCIVPIENEAQEKARMRNPAAGGVPYLSLTEIQPPTQLLFGMGTLKKYCDHDARQVCTWQAEPPEWAAAQDWARQRWAAWLDSKPQLVDGKLSFGPKAEGFRVARPQDLPAALR